MFTIALYSLETVAYFLLLLFLLKQLAYSLGWVYVGIIGYNSIVLAEKQDIPHKFSLDVAKKNIKHKIALSILFFILILILLALGVIFFRYIYATLLYNFMKYIFFVLIDTIVIGFFIRLLSFIISFKEYLYN